MQSTQRQCKLCIVSIAALALVCFVSHRMVATRGLEDNVSLFGRIRDGLDYSWHSQFSKERRQIQDQIMSRHLSICPQPNTCGNRWLVFFAGAFNSGKTFVLHVMESRHLLPAGCSVDVDPDELKALLPEWDFLTATNRTHAATLLHRESATMQEILTHAALARGMSAVVQGSMRNYAFYRDHFIPAVRRQYSTFRIGIISVTASEATVRARVAERNAAAERFVSDEIVAASLREVPLAMRTLEPLVDLFVTVRNEDAPTVTSCARCPDGEASWESVRRAWRTGSHAC